MRPGEAGPSPPAASEPIGTRVMCSTPPANTSCAAPLTTACAPKFTACSPEPQNRFTVVPGTSTGRPAASTAPRAMFMPCSPTCVTHPMITSSTSSGLTPARSSAPVSVRASRSTGCNAASAPLRLPRAVRTASTMIASPTVASQSSGMPKWILANDGLGALGADRNGDRVDPDQLLDALDVPASVLGQLLVFALVAQRLLPTGQLLVDRLGALEQLGIGGEFAHRLPVGQLVRDGDEDLLESGEHVELGHRQSRQSVHARGVAQDQRIEPAAAARPAGGGSELRADAAQPVADGVLQFGGQRAVAHARSVRLGDADDGVNRRGTDPRADRCVARHRVR